MELEKPIAGVFTQPFNHLFRIQGYWPSKYHHYDIPPTKAALQLSPDARQPTEATLQLSPDARQPTEATL